jgi:predicted ABC-type exoprotein transport system permease subunit
MNILTRFLIILSIFFLFFIEGSYSLVLVCQFANYWKEFYCGLTVTIFFTHYATSWLDELSELEQEPCSMLQFNLTHKY